MIVSGRGAFNKKKRSVLIELVGKYQFTLESSNRRIILFRVCRRERFRILRFKFLKPFIKSVRRFIVKRVGEVFVKRSRELKVFKRAGRVGERIAGRYFVFTEPFVSNRRAEIDAVSFRFRTFERWLVRKRFVRPAPLPTVGSKRVVSQKCLS